jgi:hypothetical protein
MSWNGDSNQNIIKENGLSLDEYFKHTIFKLATKINSLHFKNDKGRIWKVCVF